MEANPERNDCYKCPFRGEVPGSAHSRCNVIPEFATASLIGLSVSSGKIKGITADDKPILKFHEHGVKKGWCMWPINFDPIWVECYLPITEIKEEDEQGETQVVDAD